MHYLSVKTFPFLDLFSKYSYIQSLGALSAKYCLLNSKYLNIRLSCFEWLINKKGNFFMPFDERKAIIENLSCVDSVIDFEDDDLGSATNALIKVKELLNFY